MADIFLSYSREDSQIARRFANALQHAGFSVWWDQDIRSGETYDEVTEAALRSAKAVVVIWSPRSVRSRWVRSEATVALRNASLIPVMIEACERPVMFELNQAIDLIGWAGSPKDKRWQTLVDDIKHKLAGPNNDAEVPAPKSAAVSRAWPNIVQRWRFLALGIVPLTALGGGIYFANDWFKQIDQSSAIFSFDLEDPKDAGAKAIADQTRQELLTLLGSKGAVTISSAETEGVPRAQQVLKARELDATYAVRGQVSHADGKYTVNFSLEDVPSQKNLWESSVSGSDKEKSTVAAKAADRVFNVLRCFQTGRPHLLPEVANAFTILSKYCTHDPRFDSRHVFLDQARALSKVSERSAKIHEILASNLSGFMLFGSQSEKKAAVAEVTALLRIVESDPDGAAGAASIKADLARARGAPFKEVIEFLETAATTGESTFGKHSYATALAQSGQTSKAIAMAEQAAEAAVSNPVLQRYHAKLLAMNGQSSEAAALAQRSLQRFGTTETWEFAMVIAILYEAGDAQAIIDRRPETVSDETFSCFKRLAFEASIPDAALDECEKYMNHVSAELIYLYRNGDPDTTMAVIIDYPALDTIDLLYFEHFFTLKGAALRHHPQFLKFIEGLGLVDYWQSTKSLPDICQYAANADTNFCASLSKLTTPKGQS